MNLRDWYRAMFELEDAALMTLTADKENTARVWGRVHAARDTLTEVFTSYERQQARIADLEEENHSLLLALHDAHESSSERSADLVSELCAEGT